MSDTLVTLLFAIITVVLFSKLLKVFGTADESDRHQQQRTSENTKARSFFNINIASAFEASLPQNVRDVFDEVRKISSNFDPEHFVEGARYAFEMIVKAFANGDRETLNKLLSRTIFEAFVQEIEQRESVGDVYEVAIVKLNNSDIIDAELHNNVLTITVRFISEQIAVTKSKDGTLISGDSSHVSVIEDVWVFSKHLKTSTNIWQLVDTKSIQNP
ncbi:Tim44 domain-containing protein [Rickettsiales endosymbiont of Peranema trichophorum]|uniref:Tim44/TimA family putative adaptor protein n=1 Tax=Rickettsiales endosymbiont of Peranema trichophorum TaxID=2486577 RepID=UPI001023DAA5|nr:Tim44/TimA family putative adaptor protein [Rickettsiales endosymbiont of Peranema trichophorum]RZI47745.1 Tim44 domain-containing protein [Rickettsiales endosymbiont of Peranema trichophorum]